MGKSVGSYILTVMLFCMAACQQVEQPEAPEGYTSSKRSRYFTDITSDTFEIVDIPENGRFKLDIMYETGFGWARFLSEDIL